MTLSVLSALARQDVDPWSEAARLSQLPKETAIKQIIDLLEGLPRRTLGCFDLVEVSARLSALLPRSAGSTLSGIPPAPSSAQQQPAVFAFNWRFFCLYLCFMLLTNWLMAEFRPPPASQAVSPPAAGAVVAAPKSDAVVNSLGEEAPSAVR